MYSLQVVTFLLCGVLLARVRAIPLPDNDPEESAGYAEGDMQLTATQQMALEQGPMGRNGLIAITKRWPNRQVIYKISEDFDASHKAAILNGIQTIEKQTCVTFKEASDEDVAYLTITANPGGCYTSVGYLGKPQEMNLEIYPLGEGCFRHGTILHEFMHALGFYHQQSSAIRDNYVQIVEENIIPGKVFNFKKYSASIVTDFEVGYDYDSCLHYRPAAFSANGEDTIIPFDRSAVIGQRTGLSAKDIDKIRIMYKCPFLI